MELEASYIYLHIFGEFLEMNFKLPGTRKIGEDPGSLKPISHFSGNMTAEIEDKQMYLEGYAYQHSRIVEKYAYWLYGKYYQKECMPEQLPVTQ